MDRWFPVIRNTVFLHCWNSRRSVRPWPRICVPDNYMFHPNLNPIPDRLDRFCREQSDRRQRGGRPKLILSRIRWRCVSENLSESLDVAGCRSTLHYESRARKCALPLQTTAAFCLTLLIPAQDQIWHFCEKYVYDSTDLGKLVSLRLQVWEQDKDSLTQKIGFRLNFYMNTICESRPSACTHTVLSV